MKICNKKTSFRWHDSYLWFLRKLQHAVHQDEFRQQSIYSTVMYKLTLKFGRWEQRELKDRFLLLINLVSVVVFLVDILHITSRSMFATLYDHMFMRSNSINYISGVQPTARGARQRNLCGLRQAAFFWIEYGP